MATTAEVIAAYETIARDCRRDDWDEFVAEAREIPYEIACEVCETANYINSAYDFDSIYAATVAWLAALSRGA